MRPEKTSICAEIRARLSGSAYVLIADYHGMRVRQLNDLRRRLAGIRAGMQVVPNRLCRRVMADLHWDLPAGAFSGPTAVITGTGDAVEAAKLLWAFTQEQRLPRLKLGRFEGRCFAPADMASIVQLPGRPVLYALLAGTVAAPMTRMVGVLSQKVLSLLYVLKAVQAKKNPAQ